MATEKGLAKEKIAGKTSAPALPPLLHKAEQAQNLPPLNHGMEMAGALPPLNHNMETASSLPPLNHAKEEAANLPPLFHSVEQAGNLPPLNHGNDALQSFKSLPPLNHGTAQAEHLPPLNHGIETNGLPPLNHANEQAGILPPLLHGVEQAENAPSLNDFEKGSSQKVDALSAFTSQVENALNNNGKQPYTNTPLDLNGVGKDTLVMSKDSNARTGNAPQEGDNQSFVNDGGDFLNNYYNTKQPFIQGKEVIDRQPYVTNKENDDDSEIKEAALPEPDENAQAKNSVPPSYNDKEELQKLLTADQMSQDATTSTMEANFGNQGPSGIIALSGIYLDYQGFSCDFVYRNRKFKSKFSFLNILMR